MNPPETTRRLLAHVPEQAAAESSDLGLLIGRLLEEGETTDLRWLVSEVGESELGVWLRSRGGRQLSGRSRRFWERVLGTVASAPTTSVEELWPL